MSETTIFSYEKMSQQVQLFYQEAFSEIEIPFQLKEFEKQRLDEVSKEIHQRKDRRFVFFTDLIGAGKGPVLRYPVGHERLFKQADKLSLPYLFQSVHPEFRQTYIWWGIASTMVALNPNIRPMLQVGGQDLKYLFTVPFCVDISEPEANRKYEWWTQTSELTRLSKDNLLWTHLNIYTYFNSYQPNTQLTGGVFSDIQQEQAGNDMLIQIMKAHLLPALMANLPENEANILQAYLNGHKSIAEIQAATGHSSSTIRTYNSRLLKRLNPPEPLFPYQEFTTLKKAVAYLKKMTT